MSTVWNTMSRIGCALLALVFLSSVTAMSGIVGMEDYQEPIARTLQAWYTVDINVTVVDNSGRSIGDATVHIRGNSTTWLTNESGYVEIRGLADDVTNYTLYADKPNYLTDADLVLPILGNSSYDVTLRIIGGTIYGTVTTSQFGLIVGASVSVFDPILNLSANVSPVDGRYALVGIPGGTHPATASAPGYYNSSDSVTVAAGEAVALDFILSPRPGTISGFVFSARYPGGLIEAAVSVNLTDRTIEVQTGGDGRYLIPDLPEGFYEVVASKEGYYSISLSGIEVIKDNITSNINFTLTEKPTLLYGTVKSGALLLRLVNISVLGTGLFNISDTSGNYRIENLSALTEYNVSAARDGYVTAVITDVVIPIGGSVEMDIDLVALPGAVLIGTVVDRDDPNKILYNVAVTILISGTQQRTELTDPFGHFGFTELAAGNYTLQFQVSGYQPLEVRNVEVKENQTTNVTFHMSPLRKGFEGFIFGFDLSHSMMILALLITIMILVIAVYLRYRTFQAPEATPAVYDHEEETEEKKDELGAGEPKGDPNKKDDI